MMRCTIWLVAALVAAAPGCRTQAPSAEPVAAPAGEPVALEREIEVRQQRLLELLGDPTLESLRANAELREIAHSLPALQRRRAAQALEAGLEPGAPDS